MGISTMVTHRLIARRTFRPILLKCVTKLNKPAMRFFLLILSFLTALLNCGCSTNFPSQVDDTGRLHVTQLEITRQFNGKIGNLLGDGQIATVNYECRGFGCGPTEDGKYRVEFELTPGGPHEPSTKFQLFFVFPRLPAGQVLVTNTEARIIDAWFFRSDRNWANDVFIVKNDQGQIIEHGGKRMTGRVAIKWNSDRDFVIGADLALPEDISTWVRGEFVGSTKTKLNPILYEWPAILLFQESK